MCILDDNAVMEVSVPLALGQSSMLEVILKAHTEYEVCIRHRSLFPSDRDVLLCLTASQAGWVAPGGCGSWVDSFHRPQPGASPLVPIQAVISTAWAPGHPFLGVELSLTWPLSPPLACHSVGWWVHWPIILSNLFFQLGLGSLSKSWLRKGFVIYSILPLGRNVWVTWTSSSIYCLLGFFFFALCWICTLGASGIIYLKHLWFWPSLKTSI